MDLVHITRSDLGSNASDSIEMIPVGDDGKREKGVVWSQIVRAICVTRCSE